MRLGTAALSALVAIGWNGAALAQTQPAQTATARTVIAATKLPSVVDKPLDFRAVNITLAPGGSETVATGDGIFYQLSGSAEVVGDAETTTIGAGNGVYVAAGKSAKVTAKGPSPRRPSILLSHRRGLRVRRPRTSRRSIAPHSRSPVSGPAATILT